MKIKSYISYTKNLSGKEILNNAISSSDEYCRLASRIWLVHNSQKCFECASTCLSTYMRRYSYYFTDMKIALIFTWNECQILFFKKNNIYMLNGNKHTAIGKFKLILKYLKNEKR